MRHQSLISIKYRYVKLAFTLFGIKKNTLYMLMKMYAKTVPDLDAPKKTF